MIEDTLRRQQERINQLEDRVKELEGAQPRLQVVRGFWRDRNKHEPSGDLSFPPQWCDETCKGRLTNDRTCVRCGAQN